jgi:hypothetical protein
VNAVVCSRFELNLETITALPRFVALRRDRALGTDRESINSVPPSRSAWATQFRMVWGFGSNSLAKGTGVFCRLSARLLIVA